MFYLTFTISGSSETTEFERIEEAIAEAAIFVRDALRSETTEEFALNFNRDAKAEGQPKGRT